MSAATSTRRHGSPAQRSTTACPSLFEPWRTKKKLFSTVLSVSREARPQPWATRANVNALWGWRRARTRKYMSSREGLWSGRRNTGKIRTWRRHMWRIFGRSISLYLGYLMIIQWLMIVIPWYPWIELQFQSKKKARLTKYTMMTVGGSFIPTYLTEPPEDELEDLSDIIPSKRAKDLLMSFLDNRIGQG